MISRSIFMHLQMQIKLIGTKSSLTEDALYHLQGLVYLKL
jgi:hypothetical protein